MKLGKLLSLIKAAAEKKGWSEPFLVGGLPRDKVLNNLSDLNDLDITTGDSDIYELADFLANKFGRNATYKKMGDGHSSLYVDNLKFDFSSNFVIPNIESIVGKTLSALEQEMFSRDFTCNSLLLSLDLQTIEDPTDKGLLDIDNKILKTCVSPYITLGVDNRRIIRVIYLASKLNFSIDSNIIEYIRKNPSSIANISESFLSKKLNDALSYNKDYTIHLIKELQVAPYLPINLQQFKEIEKL